MQTRAVRVGDGWVLNGRKIWITSGATADLMVCFASTDPPRERLASRRSSSNASTPGFQVVRHDRKPGLAHGPDGRAGIRELRAARRQHAGPRGTGLDDLQCRPRMGTRRDPGRNRGHDAAAARRCVEQARSRKQFGQPIGKFQSVSNRIVEMTLRLETSRYMVYRYAWAKAHGNDASLWASMAKLHVSESFVQNSLDAVRLFGASGYVAGEGKSAIYETAWAA